MEEARSKEGNDFFNNRELPLILYYSADESKEISVDSIAKETCHLNRCLVDGAPSRLPETYNHYRCRRVNVALPGTQDIRLPQYGTIRVHVKTPLEPDKPIRAFTMEIEKLN
jgi:hypothetical protein